MDRGPNHQKIYTGIIIALSSTLLVMSGIYLVRERNLQAKGSTLLMGGQITSKTVTIPIEQEHWATRIGEVGAEQAYNEFKEFNASTDFGNQHSAAHVFGPLLYDALGEKGIAICDETFAFGCYHGFFTAALSDKGLSIVADLDQACIEKYGPYGTGCQHGIGHGLLEYIGYGNLVKALEACKRTTQKSPLFGCTSGVFMENNVPLTFGEKIAVTAPRKLNPENPYEPCTSVPAQFRESCYYQLGQWWSKVYDRDFTVLGTLCSDVKEDIYREDCYLGIGNVTAPTTVYDIAKTISLCERMPDPEGKLICRAGASWSFFANPQFRDLAPKICEGVQPYGKYTCTAAADVLRNTSNEQKI